jgi:hypothetical protein
VKQLQGMLELTEFVVKVANSDVSPQLKYELIFNDTVSARITRRFSLGELYGYHDPDTNYEEDVAAFVDAVRKLRDDLRMIEGDTITITGMVT